MRSTAFLALAALAAVHATPIAQEDGLTPYDDGPAGMTPIDTAALPEETEDTDVVAVDPVETGIDEYATLVARASATAAAASAQGLPIGLPGGDLINGLLSTVENLLNSLLGSLPSLPGVPIRRQGATAAVPDIKSQLADLLTIVTQLLSDAGIPDTLKTSLTAVSEALKSIIVPADSASSATPHSGVARVKTAKFTASGSLAASSPAAASSAHSGSAAAPSGPAASAATLPDSASGFAASAAAPSGSANTINASSVTLAPDAAAHFPDLLKALLQLLRGLAGAGANQERDLDVVAKLIATVQKLLDNIPLIGPLLSGLLGGV